MKSLIITRHAKSSWDFSSSDFARPLNDRGHHDAPAMAVRLLNKNIKIDTFISSPANRALTTAAYFFEAFNPSGDKNTGIIKIPELYHAAVSVFFDVISKVNNDLTTIAIFSHNPGITDFVNKLTNTRIDNMPTCGVFAIKVKTDNWKQFLKAEKEFWFFDYPKLKN